MEKFLQAALSVWNPQRVVNQKKATGDLTLDKIFIPFIGIILTCIALDIIAVDFFCESLPNQIIDRVNEAFPEKLLALANNSFYQNMSVILNILLSMAAVSILPKKIFSPASRNSTLATLIIISASESFYSTASNSIFYFFTGQLAIFHLKLTGFMYALSIIVQLIINITIFFVWFRIAIKILDLSKIKAATVSLVWVLSSGWI